MYTLDEINAILSDIDACGRGACSACSRSDPARHAATRVCTALPDDAAAVIRWLLSEFNRYAGEQMEVDADA